MSIRRFVEVSNHKIYFYTMGTGPVLVMLHASPSSSESLLPIARELSKDYTLFCFDTPGYGKSDRLNKKPNSLTTYTSLFNKVFNKLGLEKPAIYGTATGAQLAVRYGIEYPNAVSHIFLDNSAHFDDALASKITEHYFPDLTPKLDGSHLTTIWTIVTQLFQYFPWCFTTKEYALNRPQMPDVILQMIAMDYLKAGETYDFAYRLAFQHERAKYVRELKVPTTIFRWNNGILKKYVDQLLAHKFEDHIQEFRIDGDANERIKKMVAFINEKATEFDVSEIDLLVMKQPENEILAYVKPSNHPPEIQSDGKHLHEAWQDLILNNPGFSANKLQASLVDWYN